MKELSVKTTKSLELYNMMLKKGNGKGAYILGIIYQKGKGVDVNYPKAFKYFLKADELGYDKAPNALGICYKNGLGIGFDPKKSVDYFEKGTNFNHVVAIVNLGKIYYHGKIIQKNLDKAEELFKKAIKLGYPRAGYMLCELYENRGQKDKVYRYCKDNVDKITANKLGILYLGENNLKKATKWFMRAVEMGNIINGNRNIGLVYKIEKDYDKMREHYLLGKGYFKLAQAYEEIDDDIDRYFEILDIGKENRCQRCIKELEVMGSM